ncbi:FAD-dependent oxidoreductase [Stakelama tenebrarum]|uniref:FAD-dependent oxidoreductase n=1 Tax=Stakelama tenebrarum TaxID=2711215 RepID=A0A6G6Y2B2_9SPHN|nr:FAD-dependent oxidoreductase [Sphingosinithalassobacter tenebrarum]QIG78858.1 FAD-dependent oxidoreductase [Sphingosinithalassobacter tenebrarum]
MASEHDLGGRWDIAIVGGGSAGLPAAIFAARRGARVLLLEYADQLGGSLWVATGQMSAAGTRLQRERGIEDSAELHYEDVMRISRGTANPDIVRLAVENAAETFDWLMDEGFEPLPEHPVTGFGHEAYRLPRYYWGAEGGISVKDVLIPIVDRLVAEGKLTVALRHEVTGLTTDNLGAVTGLVARDADGDTHRISAAAVLLTCGGYAGNPEMFEQRNGYPQYNAAPYQWSRGAGLMLGESVGGYARGEENLFVNFGTLFDTDDFPARMTGRIEHFPERRKPWEIYVNSNGARFVREDVESVDAREMALLFQPKNRYWIVFDDAILNEAPPMIVGWSRDDIRAAFDRGGPAFLCADSIEALAAKAGIDASGLETSVAGFNYGVLTGNDFFGRQHAPLPIAKGPFYAIRMQASSISSAIGLAVDARLRVIRHDGSAIPNLYAAGEILGSSQTMGKAACGGMMVTPAMTFGRLLGEAMIPMGEPA